MARGLKDAAVIAAVSGVTTLSVFLSGALTVALPTIGEDLKFKQSDLQWPLNVFNLSYGCMLLLFGRISDIAGERIMFLLGSAWFALWSLGVAFAPNDIAFILFLAFEGIGAAANTPAGVSIIAKHFPPGPRRNRAFGILGAGQPVGFILGLVLGGVIVQSKATWRGIFYIQAALGALLVILGYVVFEKDTQRRYYRKGLDLGGAFLSISGVGLLTYSLADSASAPRGWATPRIIGLTCTSAVLIVAFWYYEVWRESKNLSVLMPPRMWKQDGPKLKSFILLVFFAWWNFNVLTYYSTLYIQQVELLDTVQTSIRFIPMVVAGIGANLFSGWAMNHIPSQLLMLFGLSGTIAAPIIFAVMNVHASYWTSLFWAMILIVGTDIIYPIGNLHLSTSFDEDSQALAGGIYNVATRLGTSIGLAITSSISSAVSQKYSRMHPELSPTSPAVLTIGYRAAGWTLFGVSLVSVVICLIGLRGIGYVGQMPEKNDETTALELGELGNQEKVHSVEISSAQVSSSPVPPRGEGEL